MLLKATDLIMAGSFALLVNKGLMTEKEGNDWRTCARHTHCVFSHVRTNTASIGAAFQHKRPRAPRGTLRLAALINATPSFQRRIDTRPAACSGGIQDQPATSPICQSSRSEPGIVLLTLKTIRAMAIPFASALARRFALATFAASVGVAAIPSIARSQSLPNYQPEQIIAGTIRHHGFGLGGVLKLWEEDFKKIHPGISFDDKLPTSDAAMPALITSVADLAPDGGEATLTETLAFFEVYGYTSPALRWRAVHSMARVNRMGRWCLYTKIIPCRN